MFDRAVIFLNWYHTSGVYNNRVVFALLHCADPTAVVLQTFFSQKEALGTGWRDKAGEGEKSRGKKRKIH